VLLLALSSALTRSAIVAQVVQVAGALCVLAGFTAVQLGIMATRQATYLLLNLAGSAVLAVLAGTDGQYGFLLLEGVWALVSAWSLFAHVKHGVTRSRN
jgi:hypothetical protein